MLKQARQLVTLRTGHQTVEVVYPTAAGELCDAVASCVSSGRSHRMLGRGSNLLIVNPPDVAICTTQFDSFEIEGDIVRADAGASVQKIVRRAGKLGLGGIEYLWSVPATIGGAVSMNAGRGGGQMDNCVGSKVVSVGIFDGSNVRRLSKEECEFRHRGSVFHSRPWVIVDVELRLCRRPPAEIERLMVERLDLVRRTQDTSAPNAGTIFHTGYVDHPALRRLAEGHASLSAKTPNWVLNHDDATPEQVLRLIERVELDHVARKLPKPTREIVVWQ